MNVGPPFIMSRECRLAALARSEEEDNRLLGKAVLDADQQVRSFLSRVTLAESGSNGCTHGAISRCSIGTNSSFETYRPTAGSSIIGSLLSLGTMPWSGFDISPVTGRAKLWSSAHPAGLGKAGCSSSSPEGSIKSLGRPGSGS